MIVATICLISAFTSSRASMGGGAKNHVVALAIHENQGLDPVPFTDVHIQDRFWTPRQKVNATATVNHCLDELATAGNLHNFELAAQHARKGYQGFVFNDSDVYKVLEGASDVLAVNPDPALNDRVNSIISLLAKAQMPDGYLDTYYEINDPDHRLTNLRDNHELYCAGHLMEAASAHYLATGSKSLLNIATKYADFLNQRFGPDSGVDAYGGHPELELALVKLSQVTGDKKYFNLAQKLVLTRGTHYFAKEHDTPAQDYDGTYWIDDQPLVDQTQIKGHAVRAAYLLSGATDIVRENPNSPLEHALDSIWANATERRQFITGGIGPSGSNEGFTVDYDLPNKSAYQETCASIAMSMWGYRMGLLKADASYFDAVETALYNAMLAGVSLDGKQFFYVNPLESSGGYGRSDWFACACCPPNALRTIASIGGYAYAQKGSDVYVNLYLPGSADITVNGKASHLAIEGDYPWSGKLKLSWTGAGAENGTLHLRVPGWETQPVTLNSKEVTPDESGYVVVHQDWAKDSSINLDLPMPIERVAANPEVKPDEGKVALRRGPIVYCAESIDQNAPLSNVFVPETSSVKSNWTNDFNGAELLTASAATTPKVSWWGKLYQATPVPAATTLKLIPYCDWDNRGHDAMQVWFPSAPAPSPTGGAELTAKVTASFVNGNADPTGINNGFKPKTSGDQPSALMHWWPHKGTSEWVAYAWDKPVKTSAIKVFWFDDTGRGECRLPASWELQYKDGDLWKPVQNPSGYPVEKDKWTEVTFTPVQTTELRLVVQLQPNWAAGVQQWQVIPQ